MRMPLNLVLLIIGLSLLVRVTGYYPAKKAKTISALDAIRYE